MPGGSEAYFLEAFRLADRGGAYASAKSGRRFAASHQSPGTAVTGQTSFAATTPTFLVSQSAGPKRVVLSAMSLSLVTPAPGGVVNVLVALDRTNRYSSGGTSVVPQNLLADPDDPADANAAGFSFRTNPTATAPGAGANVPRYCWHWTIPRGAANPVPFSVSFEDGAVIGKTGSLLVYTWATGTAPSWVFSFELVEED